MAGAKVKPTVLQTEMHATFNNSRVMRFCREQGIAVLVDLTHEAITKETVMQLELLGGTAAVTERWLNQRGAAFISNSLEIDSKVALTSDQMDQIDNCK